MTAGSDPSLDHIAQGIEAIQKILNDGAIIFTKEQSEGLLEILEYKELMIEDAQYRMARKIFIAKWRGAVIGGAALVSALWLLGNSFVQVIENAARALGGFK